jgi:hypothetical protein
MDKLGEYVYVKCSLLVSGERVGPVRPMRGLRQGDPLSPYIVIMCSDEELLGLLKRSKSQGEIHVIKVCRGSPLLTHLLFPDDCFYFTRPTNSNVLN